MYTSRIKKEFVGLPHSTIWQIITDRTLGDYQHLIHPCRADAKLLEKYLPSNYSTTDILPLIQEKKKILAKQYKIKDFPPDREPGFLGQAALFAVIKENVKDLSYYFYKRQEYAEDQWLEGFGLFDTLMGFTHLRRILGFGDVNILRAIFEARTPSKVIIKMEKIWLYRLFTNIAHFTPRITDNEIACQIMKKLVRVQDGWGLTVARVKEWTGLDQKNAKLYRSIVGAIGFIRRCRLVSKNTGIVRTLDLNSSLSKRVNAEDLLCSSLSDTQDCFASMNYKPRGEAEEFFEFEAYIHNIENFDHQSKEWTIPNLPQAVLSKQEIFELFCNSDLTLPDNDSIPTSRDLLFIALLQSMPVEYHPYWKDDVIKRLVRGCGIPHRDAEQGYRNVFRKNMVRHAYTFVVSGDRKQLLIVFKDSMKKTLPFLTRVIPSIPQSVFRANWDLTHGMMYIYCPQNLSDRFENFIRYTIIETDVNASAYDVLESKHAETSNLLTLIGFHSNKQ
ncbi:MAG: hypothetical protein ACFFDM_08780 [Candidatus Thorarchaeota archaeon]